MTYADADVTGYSSFGRNGSHSRGSQRRSSMRSVDLAGTAWPLYKLEAIAFGFIVFAGAVAIAGSLHIAVLAGAGAAVALWWVLRIAEHGSTATARVWASARQAPRSE